MTFRNIPERKFYRMLRSVNKTSGLHVRARLLFLVLLVGKSGKTINAVCYFTSELTYNKPPPTSFISVWLVVVTKM